MEIWHRLINSDGVLTACITAAFALLGWCFKRLSNDKAKIRWGVRDQYTYLAKRNEAETLPTMQVSISRRTFYNIGRSNAQSIEITVNCPPQHYEFYPPLPFDHTPHRDGRITLTVKSLAALTEITLNMLSVDRPLPDIVAVQCVNARVEEIKLKEVQYMPRLEAFLIVAIVSGVILWLYIIVILFRRLISS